VSDLVVWPKLAALATCLCSEVTDSGLEPLCFCGVMPGAAIALDYVDGCQGSEGMGWVRLVNAYPSNSLPQPMQTALHCTSPLAFTAEMGIVRPMGVNADGTPPDDATLLAATENQMAEMMAMYRAIACCYSLSEVVIQQYFPMGPDGGAVGGRWQFVVSAI
jgi:hypothetical protein